MSPRLQGPLAADADDPEVRDSEDEKKHKLEAQAARHHDTLDIFSEQVRPAPMAARAARPALAHGLPWSIISGLCSREYFMLVFLARLRLPFQIWPSLASQAAGPPKTCGQLPSAGCKPPKAHAGG